ncbi:MAG: radical SAM protein [Pirellulaceae bacterium]|nr:radical SAM protein [Pirellulaceae bacterium]
MAIADTSHRVKHRDYTYLGLTQSLCPECRQVVPAKIIVRGKRVYFRKQCPQHGVREDFICSDVARYDRVETSLPAKLPQQTSVEPNRGCPLDCGLCSEHEQHTCIAVLEITDGCNLTCPMCYAGSAPGKRHKSIDDIRKQIDTIVASEGRVEVVQLSGGEPTLHPQLLDAVEYALSQPIDYVMINTNGIRLANDHELVQSLAAHKQRLEIYLQFDALNDSAMQQLRGQSGLLDIKLRALDNLEKAGLNVTLVATLQGGVNDSAAADLVAFAAERKHVTGLSFQPATYSGRCLLPDELEKRITFPDVIDSIANDPRNSFTADDFVPLPCAHPNCHWISLAARDGQRLLPLTQFVDAKANLDLLANGISFTREKTEWLARQLIARLSCGDEGCCTPSLAEQSNSTNSLPVLADNSPQSADEDRELVEQFLRDAISQSVGARDILRITITSFLDVYNFDVRRVMKCCTHHVLPSGHVIPFCAYNVLYRDGTVKLPELGS